MDLVSYGYLDRYIERDCNPENEMKYREERAERAEYERLKAEYERLKAEKAAIRKTEIRTLRGEYEQGARKTYTITVQTCSCYDAEDTYGRIDLTDPQHALLTKYLPDMPGRDTAVNEYAQSLLYGIAEDVDGYRRKGEPARETDLYYYYEACSG